MVHSIGLPGTGVPVLLVFVCCFFEIKGAVVRNLLETGLAVAGFSAFGCLLGHLLGKKKGYTQGYREGVKDRENEIFTDYVIYMSADEALEFLYDIKEDENDSSDVPLMVIRPDKYDYIDGHGFDINNFKIDLH